MQNISDLENNGFSKVRCKSRVIKFMLSPESEDTLKWIEIGILCHADFNRISFNYIK